MVCEYSVLVVFIGGDYVSILFSILEGDINRSIHHSTIYHVLTVYIEPFEWFWSHSVGNYIHRNTHIFFVFLQLVISDIISLNIFRIFICYIL